MSPVTSRCVVVTCEVLIDRLIVLIQPNNVEVVPNGLAGIPDALEKMKAGKVSATKLVAHPWD